MPVIAGHLCLVLVLFPTNLLRVIMFSLNQDLLLFGFMEFVLLKTMVTCTEHTCVIGAGYGGLATARYLKQHGVNFTVFEAQRGVGGVWLEKSKEEGLPTFTGVYKNLRTNTPRQTMEFADFPFPETTPSFPTAPCFFKYLQSYTRAFDIEKYIQFRSLVTSVKWVKKQWKVDYTKIDSKENHTVICDYVVVSIGHYNRPKKFKFQGQDTFEGQIIHSQQYKDPEAFRGRRVLIIGAGPSGLDLASHLANVTSRLVHSHHLQYTQPEFGENYVKKPDVKMFLRNGVEFQDGSFEEVDDVILCIGYDLDFWFLDKNCGLTLTSRFVLPVYQNMVNIRRPTMLVLALPTPSLTRTLDAQAEYAAALIAGKFSLPPRQVMLKAWLHHVYALHAKGKKIVDVNTVFDDMDEYFGKLAAEAGTARVPPVLTDIRDFNAVVRLKDLLNYRDYDYEVLDDHHFRTWYNPKKETCDFNE